MTPSLKDDARKLVRQAIDQPRPDGIKERAVRINSVMSGLALADLIEVVRTLSSPYSLPSVSTNKDMNAQCKSPNLSTIVIPKVDSPSDLTFVSDVIAHHNAQNPDPNRTPISLIALVESARSLCNLSDICKAAPGQLSGLIFAAEDFAKDLSITRTPSLSEFLYARSMIVTAARAHEIPSVIDLVCTEYKGEKGQSVLEEEARGGKRLGFNGKQCIHPTQVGTVQRVFSPESEEVEWAVRVVIADEKAATAGRGAWSLDGKMIDVPVAEKAKNIVQRARLCGAPVEEVMDKWKGQEPE